MNDFMKNLNATTLTKEEYVVKEENERLQNWVHSLSWSIKNDIKTKARTGQYVMEGTSKKITGYVYDIDEYMSYYREYKFANVPPHIIMRTEETLPSFFKGNEQRKLTVSNWFLKVLSSTTESLKKEGLKTISLQNAFDYDGQHCVGNSIIVKRKKENLGTPQSVYYEFLY